MIKKNGKVHCDVCGKKIPFCIYYRFIEKLMYHFCDAECSTKWHESNKDKYDL